MTLVENIFYCSIYNIYIKAPKLRCRFYSLQKLFCIRVTDKNFNDVIGKTWVLYIKFSVNETPYFRKRELFITYRDTKFFVSSSRLFCAFNHFTLELCGHLLNNCA